MTITCADGGRLPRMEFRRMTRPGRLAFIPVTLTSLAAFTLSGCGSNSSDNNSSVSSPTASASSATASAGNTEAVCKDVDALKSSVSDLRNVKVNKDAVSNLSQQAHQISTDLDQLKTDAQASLRPQIDKVSAALKVVESTLSRAAANPTAANLSAIPAAISGLTSTTSDLVKALPNC
jgi:uncharacterized phage infection (PIP) family protein YhgE